MFLTFIFGKLILLIFPFNSLMHYESLDFGMFFTEVVINIVILTSLISNASVVLMFRGVQKSQARPHELESRNLW